MQLKVHNYRLKGKTASGETVVLRPMTESDWPLLVKWNNDSDVLYYSEAEEVQGLAAGHHTRDLQERFAKRLLFYRGIPRYSRRGMLVAKDEFARYCTSVSGT